MSGNSQQFSTGQDVAVYITDTARKEKGHADADRSRQVKGNTVQPGVEVLLCQHKQNKLTMPFERDSYSHGAKRTITHIGKG